MIGVACLAVEVLWFKAIGKAGKAQDIGSRLGVVGSRSAKVVDREDMGSAMGFRGVVGMRTVCGSLADAAG